MTQTRGKKKTERVKPGAILRAAGKAGDRAELPNFSDQVAPIPRPQVPAHPQRAARLEIQRDGDHIQKIIAHCQCGEEIVIDCDYASSTEATDR